MHLNYREQGAGSPIVLLHGLFGSLSNLGALAQSLSHTMRVVSFDLRNHGDSPHDGHMDLDCMARDVVESMAVLGIERASFLGHSLGGKVAMQVALMHPEQVVKLLVADIAPVHYSPSHGAVLNALELINRSLVDSRSKAKDILMKWVTDPAVGDFLLKNLYRGEDKKYRLRLNLSAISDNYNTQLLAAPKGLPFGGPALFLKGQNSAYIQDKHRTFIERLFPCADVVVIEGAGHWLHAEQPRIFNKLVGDFIGREIA